MGGSHKVQNRAISGSTKWTLVQKNFFYDSLLFTPCARRNRQENCFTYKKVMFLREGNRLDEIVVACEYLLQMTVLQDKLNCGDYHLKSICGQKRFLVNIKLSWTLTGAL